MPVNIAIIEDEPAISRNLEYILNEIDSSITVLNKMGSVKDSVKWLSGNIQRCDLLFMDIRLNDGLSFEIFEEIQPVVPVVFITAYDNHALDAFKVNGIDYILKPFDKDDIIKALHKFESAANHKTQLQFDKIKSMITRYIKSTAQDSFKKSYLVHSQNKLIPLHTDNIHWFYTTNEVVYACTANNTKYVIDSTLEQIQSEISPELFFRVNRQFIVHRKAIKDLDFYFNGRLIINTIPAPQQQIIVSKAKASALKEWINR
ncbi:LytR/AlgR family response regulator transcription factor [Abyssalbus ytuae]|uniref:LytTR family DNA-binding domain-containing protein n=1 Tax=Abyssalbus ytuae TaxID=2926907 RepID=A0A9E6ZMB1_9FLAO|nr:LytTR family DNA-binding domain-containing protein [Abyssalbus ytuae]UOB16830.1 LytTR family DNA-binding domain-containing protein [Abyssalbus ytuae]